jgi:zinc and cadmium transporter
MNLLWVLGVSVLASVGAVGAAALFLLLPERVRRSLMPMLISFATGTLLASALLELLPHAIAEAGTEASLQALLGGLVLFYLLERLLRWRHCHELGHCDVHQSAGVLILIGDGLHNFVDGVTIAAGFLVSVPVGIATGLAIVSHEIPQEVGDFGILLESGFTRKRALLLNLLSSATVFPGALAGLLALDSFAVATPYVLAMSAAGFLYIGLADLVPGLHGRLGPAIGLTQFLIMLLGIVTIIVLQGHHR